jgi:uncharacterized membrane protein
MNEATLKAVIRAEVRAQLPKLLKPFEQQYLQALDRIEQKLHQVVQPARQAEQENQKLVTQILLQLAEINRALGIDPAEAELDPNYRN